MLTKWWKLELTLATNFGSHAQMVTKFGGQILATKFGFVPDCLERLQKYKIEQILNTQNTPHILPSKWSFEVSVWVFQRKYRSVSNIRRTKSENLGDCRLVLQLPLANPVKPGVKLRMKM